MIIAIVIVAAVVAVINLAPAPIDTVIDAMPPALNAMIAPVNLAVDAVTATVNALVATLDSVIDAMTPAVNVLVAPVVAELAPVDAPLDSLVPVIWPHPALVGTGAWAHPALIRAATLAHTALIRTGTGTHATVFRRAAFAGAALVCATTLDPRVALLTSIVTAALPAICARLPAFATIALLRLAGEGDRLRGGDGDQAWTGKKPAGQNGAGERSKHHRWRPFLLPPGHTRPGFHVNPLRVT